MMSGKVIAGMICCVLIFGGCAANNTKGLKPDEAATVETMQGLIIERAELSADEQAAFRIALDDFGQYLVRRFGASRLRECNERIMRSAGIYESLYETYETSPIFLLQDFYRGSSPKKRMDVPGWLTSASDHFVFQYHPRSSAERDIEIIKREAENALAGACAELGFKLETLEDRFDSFIAVFDSVSGDYFADQGDWVFTGGRMPVTLTEDSDEYHDIGGPKYTSGVYQLSLVETERFKGPLYCARAMFQYRTVLHLTTLDHEIFHAVHLLVNAAAPAVMMDYMKNRMEKRTAFTRRDFELIHSINYDKYLVEGLATWYGTQRGLVPRALKIPAMSRMATEFLHRDGDLPLKRIVGWNPSLNFFEKAATVFGSEKYVKREMSRLYIGAGSFLEYILAEFDAEKFQFLLFRTDGDSGERIRAIFGTDLEEMDRRWKEWMKNPPSRPEM
jgi:hypothetical protein